jgi:uncharacterized protein YpmB
MINFENQSFNKTLYEEQEETVYFSIKGIQNKKTTIQIGKYNIPAFIINNVMNNSKENISKLDFSIDNLNAIVFSNKTYFFTFYLENNGQIDINNISFDNIANAAIVPLKFDSLKAQEKKQINMTIFIPQEQIKNITANITAKYSNYSISLPVYFEITENKSKVTLPGINTTSTLSCKNIGKICLTDEECNGQLTPSLEAACCIGECIKKKQSSGNWIYGLILIVIVLAIAVFILWKYKQRQNLRPKSIDEIMREKVNLRKINKRKSSSDVTEEEI